MADAAEELYGLPLQEFTKARNELERRLRGEGKRDEAQAVKGLRKPTAAAWALNQLARRRKADVERLLAAGERLRQAQDDLLGGGDRAILADAAAEEREVVGRLARDATAIGAEAGLGSSGALEEKVRSTLHAAAADVETARELAAGRLVRERQAVGLIGFEQMPAASPGGARSGAGGEAGRARESGGTRTRAGRARESGGTARSGGGDSSGARAKAGGEGRTVRTGKRAAAKERAEQKRAEREAQRREQEWELERSLKAARSEETKLRRRAEAAERMTASARERAAKAADRLDAAEEDEASARAELEALSDQVERAERELRRLSRRR